MSRPAASTLVPVPGAGALPKVVLLAPDGARAEVYLHGGHVTAWRPAGEPDGPDAERLFLSGTAEFRAGAAIRGGVPVIFPQFAAEGPLPRHGFARTAAWSLLRGERSAAAATVVLGLADSAETRRVWPHAFAAELAVTVGGRTLELALTVRNADAAPLAFTAALHTYLRVADVRETVVRGLHGAAYRDSTAAGARRTDGEPALRVRGEVDRVYLDVPGPVAVEESGRTTTVAQAGFRDVVLWNPGAERGAALADLEPDGWGRMLCVEAAAVGEPVRLDAGERWTGTQTLTAG